MKKVFSIICLFLICVVLKAQVVDTRKGSWYVSGNVGTSIWNSSDSWTKPNDVLVNFSIGKELTPIFGLELGMDVGMNQGGKTFFDSHNLTASVATNISNLILGYDGHRKLFEPILLIGGGWYHAYDNVYNTISAHGAVRCNFNITNKWAINITPEYNILPNPVYQRFNLYVGATYRFKNDNFPIVRLYDENEIKSLNSEINRLRKVLKNTPKTVYKTDTVTIYVEKTNYISPTIQFVQGSEKISETSKANIKDLAKYITNSGYNYVIEGYASEEGDTNYNQNLSIERAESVADQLFKFGVPEDKIKIQGNGETDEFGDREFNRIVIITEQ